MAVDRRAPRIGVFGGTFDPVHIGHLIIASELRHALDLDRLLFVPTGQPPHKADQAISADADRLAMLELAIGDDPAFEISTVDLERAGPSYTADLLTLLSGQLPGAQLLFLMGEDSLRDLPTWHQPETILALAELGIAARPDIDLDLAALYDRLPDARGRIHVVPTTLIGVSSSGLRRRVREGRPIRYLVPRSVETYIMSNSLYHSGQE